MTSCQKIILFAILAYVPVSLSLSPIILVPGYKGSRLQATLNKETSAHPWCQLKANKYTIWLNPAEMLPMAINCFTENMKMKYDNVTRTTSDNDGVKITVPGFGDTETIEYLDPNHFLDQGKYFDKTVSFLVERGYVRGRSIRGAPYDFRKAPVEQGEYFKNLKNLVEETYGFNNNKKVMLVGHSMGCDMLIQFLSLQQPAWKNKYVKVLVTLAGPFSGAAGSPIPVISGSTFGSKIIKGLDTRPAVRTYSAVTSFFPNPNLWDPEHVLVETPNRNYSVNDYKKLFEDLNWETGYEMLKDSMNKINNNTAPGVEMHCLYGSGKKTIERVTYDENFPDSPPVSGVYGDGDGTVNRRSLESCNTLWGDQDKFVSKAFANTSHGGIMRKEEVLEYIYHLANE